MNILFLSELFYPHGGGAELANYLYAKLLSENNHRITVITNKFEGEIEKSEDNGFTVYRLPLFSEGDSLKFSTLKRIDVLYSETFMKHIREADIVYIPRYWFSAIPRVKALGKPVIVHLHDYIPICPLAVSYNSESDDICKYVYGCSLNCIFSHERRKRSLLSAFGSTILNYSIWPFIRRYVNLSDAIICVSKSQRDALIKKDPMLNGKIKVLYNPMPEIKIMQMKGDDFGYFGGRNYFKGYNVLLNALLSLHNKRHPRITVHGTKFSGINNKLLSFYDLLGLKTYQKLSSKSFDEVLSKIRTVIVPSVWNEPLPYVVAEGLLKGKLVIASKIGGMPELLKDCKGSYVFSPKNHDELAEKMSYVSNLDRETAIELGINNRKSFLKLHNNDDVITKFITICDAVINRDDKYSH